MIFAKVEMAEVREVKVIESSERGSGGFGHTGMN
jgi:dUTPase